MVTEKWRPGHWVEMTAIRGVGEPRHGVEEFPHNHTIHWEFGGWGMEALSHSPNMKVNQTVNVNAGAPLALSPYPDPFPGNTSLMTCRLKEAQLTDGSHRFPGAGVGELWGPSDS